MTCDLLGAKTKISFKWLASLKIGFEEDDLPGHWLRTSLRISLLILWYAVQSGGRAGDRRRIQSDKIHDLYKLIFLNIASSGSILLLICMM